MFETTDQILYDNPILVSCLSLNHPFPRRFCRCTVVPPLEASLHPSLGGECLGQGASRDPKLKNKNGFQYTRELADRIFKKHWTTDRILFACYLVYEKNKNTWESKFIQRFIRLICYRSS